MDKQYSMVFLVNNCIDCKACMVACKAQWNVPADHFRTKIASKDVSFANGSFRTYFLPWQCNHCKDAPCVSVCPTTASYKDEKNGTVNIDEKKCVGCKYCIVSCPYEARFYNEEKGIADKCSFCLSRVEAGLKPACVSTCLASARIFGDLNDPKSDVSVAIANAVQRKAKIWRLREDLGTEPSIYYVQG